MRISIDTLCVVVALIGLLILGWTQQTPFFEAINQSRLAYLTVLTLPFFILVTLIRGHHHRMVGAFGAWAPAVGVLLVYESLKHMHANQITEWLGITPKDRLMLEIDERIFFGKALPLWLEDLSSPWVTQIMWFFYVWVYYLGPVLLMGWAYFIKADRLLFLQIRRATILGLLGGYIGYLLVPVEGPLFHIGEQFTRPILTQPTLQRLVFSTLRFNWDCFPSLHTAIPWLLTFVSWTALPIVGRWLAVIGASGITLSTVVLRFHYGIDLLAGMLWAGLVWKLVDRIRSTSWSLEIPMPDRRHLSFRSLRFRLIGLSVMFVTTGCAGLLAEQAFEKLLQTLLGASTPAAAVVLAVYFLGLTLGAASGGRLLLHVPNALRLYAYLEGGIAIWALLLYLGFGHLSNAFVPVLSVGADRPWLLQGLRFLVATVWILPPTFMMGATFPAMVAALKEMRAPKPRKTMARFYTLNLLGAVLGSLIGPYVAFPRWGVDGTMLFTFVLDGLVFVAALYVSETTRQASRRGPPPEPVVAWRPLRLPQMDPAKLLLLSVSWISGSIFFSLEVLWTHLLSAVLGNSVYAFAAMLSLVLWGLWLGGAIGTRIGRGDRALPAWIVSGLYLGGSGMLLATFDRWPEIPHSFTVWGAGLTTFRQGETLRWIQAGIQILPGATVLGMVYPSLFRLDGFPVKDRETFVGWMGAFNAVGCILGALLTGFVLIPRIGSELCLLTLGMMCAVLAALLAWQFSTGIVRTAILSIAVLLVGTWAVRSPWNELDLSSGEHVYFRPNQVFPESRLVFFHEDTYGGITTVVQNPKGVRNQPNPYLTLLTNGKFQGNDSWETDAQTGFALIPILHARGFEDACVIGLGIGHSAQVVAAMGFQNIRVAEISPGIVEAARQHFGHVNGNLFSRPNVRLILEDGRNDLLLNPGLRYDLVTMEISSVWFAGSTNLYSREFYELVRSRLKPGGIFQQWIQLHHIGTPEVGSVIATIRSVFPQVSFWVFGGQGILVASQNPLELNQEAARRFLRLMPDKETQGRAYLQSVLASRLLSPDDVTTLANIIPLTINTDRNRFLEYATPRYNLSPYDHKSHNVRSIGKMANFPDHVIRGGETGPLDGMTSGRLMQTHFFPKSAEQAAPP